MELARGVLPNRLEYPVAVVSSLVDPVPDQALVQERLERIKVGSGYGVRGGHRATAGEDRKCAKDALFVRVEELIRPRNRRVERPLPLLDVAVARGKETKAFTQPLADGERR